MLRPLASAHTSAFRAQHAAPLRLVFVILFLCTAPISAQGNTYSTKLHQIINKIQHVKTNIKKAVRTQSSLQRQVQKTDQAINSIAKQKKETQKQLIKQLTIQQQLRADRSRAQQQLRFQQSALAQQIRAAYRLGQPKALKVFLNQQTPSTFGRTSMYYQYLNRSQLALIQEHQETLKKLAETEKQIQQNTRQLLSLQNKQHHQRQQLQRNKQNRTRLLRSIKQKLHTQQQQLSKLLANKLALGKLIQRLSKAQNAIPPSKSFTQLRHRLHWPTKGKLRQRFGATINHSQLKSNGVLISAPEGQNIYAIAPGRVVFADWLRGYGLLLIIDHGHGYMSLYGRNQSLYKKTGQTVRDHALIASVGKSGGFLKSGLYFAIRRNGKPMNPTVWCKG